jgi:hypothetical protein
MPSIDHSVSTEKRKRLDLLTLQLTASSISIQSPTKPRAVWCSTDWENLSDPQTQRERAFAVEATAPVAEIHDPTRRPWAERPVALPPALPGS